MKESIVSNNKTARFWSIWRYTSADWWLVRATFWPAVVLGGMLGILKGLHEAKFVSRDVAVGLSLIAGVAACVVVLNFIAKYWLRLDELERKIEGLTYFAWGYAGMIGLLLGMLIEQFYAVKVSFLWAALGMGMAYMPIRALVRWHSEG